MNLILLSYSELEELCKLSPMILYSEFSEDRDSKDDDYTCDKFKITKDGNIIIHKKIDMKDFVDIIIKLKEKYNYEDDEDIIFERCYFYEGKRIIKGKGDELDTVILEWGS